MSHILGTHHTNVWQLFPHDRSNMFFLSEGEVDGGKGRDDGNCVDALLQCLRFNVGSITNNGCTKVTCLFADLVTSRLNLGGVDTRDFASVNLQSARNEKAGAFQDWPEGSDDRQMRRILKEDTVFQVWWKAELDNVGAEGHTVVPMEIAWTSVACGA